MLPRGCCSCCQDENEMAPRDRFSDDGDGTSLSIGCADFCGANRMSEGRQSQVVLLDDRKLDILIKPKLYAGELLDMMASHFSLKEKEYFGLAYLDDTGHYSWLQLDRRVLEHEFPKRSAQSTLVLYFRIKYFVESITHLRDSSTVEAFYLQTQSLVYNGIIEVSSEKAFQLAALVLQATHGDYSSTDLAKQHLKKLPVLPTSCLVEHPSLSICEDRVVDQYKTFIGQSRGSAIVNYMRVAESLPTYGVHYYDVKDKAGIPWWLGINFKGICQYDQSDRKVPRKLFLWKQLENLYFRDRKFSIEVYDPKRLSASRKTFGPGNISVYVWFASSPSLTKCIWSMAIAQHQFYLDRKHNKSALSLSRNFSDIADELSHGSYSTETSSLGRSVSSLSLPALKIDSETYDSCDETVDTGEMFVALKARREALEEALHRKCEELKKLCLREGELTGALPPEMPLTPGEQIPIIRKKIGAGYPIKDKLLWKKKSKDEEELARLELEYEIQTKIVNAAFKLLNDSSVKKNIRRQRKISHQKALQKHKEIEQRLIQFRKLNPSLRKNSSTKLSDTDQLIQTTSANLKDLTLTLSPTDSDNEDAKNSFNKMKTSVSSPVPLPNILRNNSNSVPSSPSNSRHTPNQRHSIGQKTNIINPDLCLQGYTPSTVYQTQTSYRSQQYPTFSMRSPSSYSSASSSDYGNYGDKNFPITPLSAPYRNRFESTLDLEGSNLYSVPTQRTSQAFDTQDDILAALLSNPQDLGLISRHNSLDRNRRHSFQKYRRLMADNPALFGDIQRPSSVQPPYKYDTLPGIKTRGVGMFPYQEQQQQQRQNYPLHHPHHFHHHRHIEDKSPTSESYKGFPGNVSQTVHEHFHKDTNMYQKNLKLYAPEAMYVGERKKPDSLYKNTSSSTLKPPDKLWTDFPADPKSKTASSSPFDSGLSSPSSVTERSWPSRSPQNVPSSSSMSSLQSHSTQSHPPNVNIVQYGHFQPYWEETKPYETSDFYKYSTKHRKQQHQAASQNLHAKLSAWKANQTNTQHTSTVSQAMSPVLERSRTVSPASTITSNHSKIPEHSAIVPGDCTKKPSNPGDPKSSASGEQGVSTDAFHDQILDWFNKQEKGKKITLV